MTRARCAVFLAVFLLLLLPARIEIQDEEVFLNTALNLLETGLPVYTAGDLVFYQRYSPVYATILAGYLAIARPLSEALAWSPAVAPLLAWGSVLTFNILVTVLLFLAMSRALPRPPVLWLAAVASSLPLYYATTLFMDPLLALLLFVAAGLAARGRSMSAALALALLSLLKLTNLIYAPLLVSVLVAAPSRAATPTRARALCALAVALGIPLAFHLSFNVLVRGNLLDFGYAPVYPDPLTGEWRAQGFTHSIPRGLLGFLLSPGKSILLYAPLAVFGIFGLVRGWRLGIPLARITAAWAAGTVLLYAGWSQWEGGMCYGPRLLLPAVPLLLAGLAWLPRARALPLVAATILGLTLHVTARIGPIYPAYLTTGAYGTGISYPIAHNFLAAHAAAAALIPRALHAAAPQNLVPALLAAQGAPRGAAKAWLVAVAGLALAIPTGLVVVLRQEPTRPPPDV